MSFIFLKRFLFLAVLCSVTDFFGYIVGANLSYDWQSGTLYKISLEIIIDCDAVNDLGASPSQTIFLENEQFSQPQAVVLNRVFERDLNFTCDDLVTTCEGGIIDGYKRVRFEGIYDFAIPNESEEPLRFYWNKNFRSASIDILNNGQQYAYYTELLVHDFSVRNSSPILGGNLIVPLCVDDTTHLNYTTTDRQNDDVVTELVIPRISEQVELPFNFFNPFGSGTDMVMNNNILTVVTGSDTVSSIIEISLQDYRNGQLLSETFQSLYLQNSSCNNVAPVLTGFNGTERLDTSFCAGTSVSPEELFLRASDADTLQELTFKVFGSRSVGAQFEDSLGQCIGFNWNIRNSDVGTHVFLIQVKDDACPFGMIDQKIVTIEVLPAPNYSLPSDFVLACDSVPTLTPSGVIEEDYTHVWGNYNDSLGVLDTIFEGVDFVPPSHGNYYTEISSSNGCSILKSIHVQNSISGELMFDNWCHTDTVKFSTTASSSWGNLTSIIWDFDDQSGLETGVEDVNQHLYNGQLTFEPRVIVTDPRNCVDTISVDLNLCVPPLFDFEILDTCNNNIVIEDNTPYANECSLDRMYPNSGYYDEQRSTFFFNEKPIVGTFEFRTTAIYESGCRVDTAFDVNLIDSPTLLFMEGNTVVEDFAFRCNDPDTTLQVKILSEGNGGITPIDWVFGSFSYTQINDSTVFTDASGSFTAHIMDSMGCYYKHEVIIRDDLDARFKYETICTQGDTIHFNNLSRYGLSTISDVRWEFGDGDTSSISEPSHQYTVPGDYAVKLIVTDIYDCVDSLQHVVFANAIRKDSIDFESVINSNVICSEIDTLDFRLPNYNHLDSIIWENSLGQNSKHIIGVNPLLESLLRKYYFPQPSDSEFVSTSIYYNSNGNVGIGSCEYNVTVDSINVFQKLDGDVSSTRTCLGDTAALIFEVDTSGSALSSIHWVLHDVNDSLVALDTAAFNPYLVFDSLDTYSYEVVVTNEDGCTVEKYSGVDNQYIEIQKVSKPYMVVSDTACFNETAQFEIKVRDFGEITHWEVYDENFNKIFPKSNDPELFFPGQFGNQTIQNGTVNHSFLNHGSNDIHVFMIGSVGNVAECRSRLDTIVFVDTLPTMSFDFETACARDEKAHFANSSSFPLNDSLISTEWYYQENLIGEEDSSSYVFSEGGDHELAVVSRGTRCSDTLSSTVYVKHKPEAAFGYDEEKLEAFIPIQFFDESISETELLSSKYAFGNGDSSSEFDPVYEYDTVLIYQVSHSVTTIEGCSDTTTRRTDLNTYLEIPNAFTPNGDGQNDKFFLVNKSIHELYEYKIYNAHGKLVFDGGTDPDAVWDGSYEGTPMDKGIFILKVRGLGAYETLFELKENITLLR